MKISHFGCEKRFTARGLAKKAKVNVEEDFGASMRDPTPTTPIVFSMMLRQVLGRRCHMYSFDISQ